MTTQQTLPTFPYFQFNYHDFRKIQSSSVLEKVGHENTV